MKLYLIILTILSLSQNAIARSNSVNATFFKTDITLDAGEPLGGYFERNKFIFNSKTSDFFRINLFKKSVGVSDKNYARGMIIKNKANRKILFLSVDTIALDKKFYKDLISKIGYLGFHSSNVIAIASHTHSGPGTLSKNFMWQFFAMGFYNGDNYKKIIQNIQWYKLVPSMMYQHY